MEQDFRKVLALNVKVERVKTSLTQEQLAELAEVSTKHLTKIENAKVTASSYLVYKIAEALKINVDKLFYESE